MARIKTIKIMMGIDDLTAEDILKREFKGISWWSDSLETVANYYDGCAIEMTVKLDSKVEMKFVDNWKQFNKLRIPFKEYTYGFKDHNGSVWYSFNADYLIKYCVSIKEIHPDLSIYFNKEAI